MGILHEMDHQKARELIRSERTSMDSIRYIIHDLAMWASKIEELKKKVQGFIRVTFDENLRKKKDLNINYFIDLLPNKSIYKSVK